MAVDIIARAMAKKASKNYDNYNNKDSFPETGESGQLYFDTDNSIIYFWDEKKDSYEMLVTVEGNEDIVTKELVEDSVQECLTNKNIVLDGGEL